MTERCLMGICEPRSATGIDESCHKCGFYSAEFERRRSIPFTVDEETGIRRKAIRHENKSEESTEDGG